ncbi:MULTISPECIES: DUF397 domain-containing protein [Streptomyces]|uniref:DUF397 domain-containing protein n=1 Tax=Streptomyces venezuelae TaxID=54571 RepID=A0A5P2BAG8_STRVZ|nr:MULTISPECIES: DUF397 domain-containing protein [Streptomyces]NDZ98996.1 DUF397 domain-containing protein [Streptomyces sp. SID10116]MYY87650.1 DUF397 domain-containing protein [Streptomyces sp. SID335]NDZ88660.1 DUF397 domain-containing protein [Streptomyces sp. SID10115]NEB43828.1 DUF397 domain-containing protein [Streptomyces sp. SID339]QES27502.1 DUF397 domain-containing protein [Streptomyces venezuelae]
MIRKGTTGDRLELEWFKSSYSSSSNGEDCVEIATTPAHIHIRDSKTPHTPHLTLTPSTWSAFVTYAAYASQDSEA